MYKFEVDAIAAYPLKLFVRWHAIDAIFAGRLDARSFGRMVRQEFCDSLRT